MVSPAPQGDLVPPDTPAEEDEGEEDELESLPQTQQRRSDPQTHRPANVGQEPLRLHTTVIVSVNTQFVPRVCACVCVCACEEIETERDRETERQRDTERILIKNILTL